MEQFIKQLLSRFPKVKKRVKQFILFKRFFTIAYYKYNDKQAKHYKIDLPVRESFFGYYDKSPWSKDGAKFLVHGINSKTNAAPNPFKDTVVVFVVDNHTKKILVRSKSNTFNWQQGTRLQWLTNNKFIFNDFDSDQNQFCSKIISLDNPRNNEQINHPIYDCHKDQFSISLNFKADICQA